MGGIQRKGDRNVAGGAILEGDPTVLINGKPIALVNAPVSAHTNFKGPHNNARTTNNGQPTNIYCNGKLVCRSGSIDTCGHPRTNGSPDVNLG